MAVSSAMNQSNAIIVPCCLEKSSAHATLNGGHPAR
jgi:hypothetical protein